MSMEVLRDVISGLPKNWKVEPLKFVVVINPEQLPESTPGDTEIRYIDIGNVNARGEIEASEELIFAYAPTRARRVVRAGDCIISTVRTYLRAIARVDAINDGWIVSTGFAVLRPGPEVESTFLLRVLQSEPFVQAVVANSEGVSYPAISPSKLVRMPFWFPPTLDEQLEISAFIDSQVSAYDQMARPRKSKVENVGGLMEEFVSLVAERTSAIITAAVTGQIDTTKAA